MVGEVIGSERPDRSRRIDQRGYFLRRILVLTDVLALVCAYVVAEIVVGFERQGPHALPRSAALLAIAIPAWLVFARAHDLYHTDGRRPDHSAAEELAPIIWMTTLWSWSIVLLEPLLELRHASLAKLGVFWLATVFFLISLRSIARAWARRQSWYQQRALVVGTPAEASILMPKILRHPEYGMQIVAFVELPPDRTDPELALVSPVPVIAGEADLLEVLGELEVDRVLLGPSIHRLPDFKRVFNELRNLRLKVDMVPSWFDVVGSRAEFHELEGMPLLAVPDYRLGRSSLWAKRALDLAIASLSLVMLWPLLLACAIAIKLDSPGPVLFRQRRVGRGDRRFELLKFRSMRVDAEKLKEQVAELNFHGGAIARGMFKINGDPRVTRVGRFLRRYSLDELPQLINVLRGEMSLVGPRPLIENEDCQIAGYHRGRLRLTPGLTGLWQVNGRSNIPFEGMIDLDYLYVTNWSLWGDIKLLMRTFAVIVRGHGAY